MPSRAADAILLSSPLVVDFYLLAAFKADAAPEPDLQVGELKARLELLPDEALRTAFRHCLDLLVPKSDASRATASLQDAGDILEQLEPVMNLKQAG